MRKAECIRFVWSIAMWLLVSVVGAQTQQGYVKTKGRMVNGQVVPGKGLIGAVVSLKGRTAVLVNQSDGHFSFPIVGQTFVIEGVTKQGYQLVDADISRTPFQYAESPIYLVMETPEQQLEDQLEAKERITMALRKQYQSALAENKRLREERRISQDEYEKAMQRLVSQQRNNSVFVSKLVDEFSKVDYDQLDEFNRRVHEFILNGEFRQADSMLATKGDMSSRIVAFQNEWQVLTKEENRLSQQQQAADQLDSHLRKQLADLAQDCLSKYQIFKMRFQNDSAAYYLELRAGLDTANVEYQRQAGDFLTDYLNNYSQAEVYYQRALSCANRFYGEESDWSATLLNQIANVLYYQDRYTEALQKYEQSLAISRLDESRQALNITVNMRNMAAIYRNINNDYRKALAVYEKTLTMRQELLGQRHPLIAEVLFDIGVSYNNLGEYDKALGYEEKALDMFRESGDEYLTDIASVLDGIGTIYFNQGEYGQTLNYYKQSFDIRKEIFGQHHVLTADNLRGIGDTFYRLGEYDQALDYLNKSLAIRMEKQGEKHTGVASTLNAIGNVYYNKKEYRVALDHYIRALAIQKQVLGEKNRVVATTLNNIANTYRNQEDYATAATYYVQVLAIRKDLLGPRHPLVSVGLNELGNAYRILKQNDKAIDCYEQVLDIGPTPQGLCELDIVSVLRYTSMLYSMKGNLEKAVAYAERALPLLRKEYGEHHEEVAANIYLTAMIYSAYHQDEKALEFFKQALNEFKIIENANPRYIKKCTEAIAAIHERQKALEGNREK